MTFVIGRRVGDGDILTFIGVNLASELRVFIIIITNNAIFYSVDDSFLQRAASSIPKHSIFLLEDIDCAFRTREDDEDDRNVLTGFNGRLGSPFMGMRRSPVTLSALLNVIDGVGSEEGKLFFATVAILNQTICLAILKNYNPTDESCGSFGPRITPPGTD